MNEIRELPVEDISADGDTQIRQQMEWMAVSEYAAAMQEGTDFPPIDVFFDGVNYWLSDGFHRLEAAKRVERQTIAAHVRNGDKRDAILYAIEVNTRHGVRLTNRDKRRMVEMFLNDPVWSQWSNVEISRQCGVSDELVRKIRNSIFQRLEDTPRTVHRNGTTYTMNTANIGKQDEKPEPPQPELFAEENENTYENWPDTHEGDGPSETGDRRASEEEIEALFGSHKVEVFEPSPKPQKCDRCGLPLADYDEHETCNACMRDAGEREAVDSCFNCKHRETDGSDYNRFWCAPMGATYPFDMLPTPCDLEMHELDESEDPEPQPAPIIPPIETSNVILNYDACHLSEYVTDPVQLVITSPPYNVGIDYDTHTDNLSTYFELITQVWRECYAVMQDGARIAVVVPFGVGRNPWVPLASKVMDTITDAGFTLRGQIIWDKNTSGNRTTWGSFRLPSDPGLRDTTECVIVAHKNQSKLELPDGVKLKDEKGTYSPYLSLSDDFMDMAQDHWVIAPESAQRVKHPAPFPAELARRLIRFYAYPEATILDPFGGSGSTAVAAIELGCHSILFDISEDYCSIAEERCNDARNRRSTKAQSKRIPESRL